MSRSRELVRLTRRLLSRSPKTYALAGNIYHLLIFTWEWVNIRWRHPRVKIHPRLKLDGNDRNAGFHSQYGQDKILLSEGLVPKFGGSFVEVGANLPSANSNSWYFETEAGYSGISVDGIDYSKEWIECRPKSNFINAVVSSEHNPVVFCRVSGPAGWEDQLSGPENTLDLGGKSLIVSKYEIETISLAKLISRLGKRPDILFVDVEGHELKVLESNDWEVSRPRVIVIENFGLNKKQEELRKYMMNLGYDFSHRIWISDDIYTTRI